MKSGVWVKWRAGSSELRPVLLVFQGCFEYPMDRVEGAVSRGSLHSGHTMTKDDQEILLLSDHGRNPDRTGMHGESEFERVGVEYEVWIRTEPGNEPGG